jgi:cytochrome P450
MIAGSETTATLLSGLSFLLLKNQHAYHCLKEELREAFQSSKDITLAKLAKLEYLNACIQEALRLYPPVPIGLPRFVPDQGATICGEFIPRGTSVYVSQYAAYHSEANFADPESFIPERWLPDTDTKFIKDDQRVLQAFSVGPRNCIGKR